MTSRLKPIFKITSLLFAASLLQACGQQPPKNNSEENTQSAAEKPTIATVEVHNPSNFERPAQSVYLSYYDLGLANGEPHTLLATTQQTLLASQAVDIDFDGINDGLLVETPLKAAETATVIIAKAEELPKGTKRTQAEISHKQGGEWTTHSKQPDSSFKGYQGGEFVNVEKLTPPSHYTDHSNWIRYEGPGIESDKVGYRIYLDHRNGFDIFGKKISEPVLQLVGQDGYDSYHEMQPWGMDILKVGSSLGAGGFGLWHEDKLQLISDVQSWTATINENGDLRSSLTIDYQGWKSELGQQDISAHVSMQAGSRLAKMSVNLEKSLETLAAGVVKHKNTEFIQGNLDITGKAYSYIASWGQQALDGSMLGMAVFFKKENVVKITQDETNYLAVLKPFGKPNAAQPAAAQLNYYFASVWQPESGIATKEAFVQYLEQEAEKLTVQPRVSLTTELSTNAKSEKLTAEQALNWAKRLADSEITRKGKTYNYDGWDVHRKRLPKFEYDIVGLYPNSLYRLGEATGSDKYKQMIQDVTASFITDSGEIKRYNYDSFNIDAVAPGVAVLSLYKQTGEEKYQKAAALLRKQLVEHPKTSEGAFWHKKKYTHQIWLDGVYMGMPFLAEYANLFEGADSHSLEEVVNEFVLTRKYLKDPETGYYYHAWDESKSQNWANPETGVSPEFWARGMGWMTMALVDVLELIPESKTELTAPLLEMAAEVAESVVRAQDPDSGTWWQVMDKPGTTGNYRESSATAMFVYFLAKAVNNGYIDSSYKAAAIKGYQGLINEFVLVHENGEISMTNQCYVAGLGFGRDGSYGYYMSEPVWQNDAKGTGPFILAGIAMHDLLSR